MVSQQRAAKPRVAVTTLEAARLLGVSRGTVPPLVHAGELEGYTVGRVIKVFEDSIAAYQERQRITPAAAAPVALRGRR